jgi:hypothetical protein
LRREDRLYYTLRKLLPDEICIRNGYYSFLPSPKGNAMQLDVYFPNLKLAVEYNGRQHYKYTKKFHKTQEAFQYLRKCDQLKKKLCKELGITLIIVDYTHSPTEDYIRKRLKHKGVNV